MDIHAGLPFSPQPFSFRLIRAHITSMYRRPQTATPRSREMTAGQQAALAKARQFNPTHQQKNRANLKIDHPELSKKKIRSGKKDNIPWVVGGSPPPVSSFARRRQFGLRALDR